MIGDLFDNKIFDLVILILACIGWNRANYWKAKADISDKISEFLYKKTSQDCKDEGEPKP